MLLHLHRDTNEQQTDTFDDTDEQHDYNRCAVEYFVYCVTLCGTECSVMLSQCGCVVCQPSCCRLKRKMTRPRNSTQV